MKKLKKIRLNLHDDSCKLCPRLTDYLADTRERFPEYRCLPVPSFGNVGAKVLVVGLAPGLHGANATGRPFTGDHAGKLLYSTLFNRGLSNQPDSVYVGDGLVLSGCRIVNAVKCLPPNNKPNNAEIKNCNKFLSAEIESLEYGSVLIALGKIAHDAILRTQNVPLSRYKFNHGAEHWLSTRNLRLFDSYHCSRYNTQTRRLTENMFDEVFQKAISALNEVDGCEQ